MQKVRVAFFADILVEDYDGAARTMFQLLKRIPQKDFEFLFICGMGPDNLFGYECLKIPSVTVPFNTDYKMAIPQFVGQRIKEKLLEFEPDVIHIATPSLLGQFAIKFAHSYLIPVITIYHTHFIAYIDYYLKHIPFLIDWAKAKITVGQSTFYNQCDKIYVPSESIADELTDIGIEVARIKMWKRGIDTNLFSPLKRNIGEMRKLTGNDHPIILFASRLVWEKNLETLFRIYDCIEKRKLQYNLVVAGDGVAASACKSVMKNAVFLGNVNHDQLSYLYASSDVFIFPSVTESYGNVVLEAMASGLPCVIANGGGSKDFVQQGLNGFKCDAHNEEDYVDKIQMLLSNKKLWEQFSEEGRKYSLNYDWENLAAVYFNDVSELAQKAAIEIGYQHF